MKKGMIPDEEFKTKEKALNDRAFKASSVSLGLGSNEMKPVDRGLLEIFPKGKGRKDIEFQYVENRFIRFRLVDKSGAIVDFDFRQ